MEQEHSCVVFAPRETDFIQGINSPIVFKAVSSGDWTPYLKFFESQRSQFETDGCVPFTAQESFDAQMELLISSGQVSASLLSLFNELGYMDTNSLDGKAHFHSSARFLQVLTGNGQNGNPPPAPWDVMRKYGVLPWKDLPYDSTITLEEYFTTITTEQFAKAAKLLAAIGGKDAIQYHFVANGKENLPAMQTARQQAPLCICVTASVPGWNQVQPVFTNSNPSGHMILDYARLNGEAILDHYQPYEKVLVDGYAIPYALQGVVSIIPPPVPVAPVPVLPTNPTKPQILTWLNQLTTWLQSLLK